LTAIFGNNEPIRIILTVLARLATAIIIVLAGRILAQLARKGGRRLLRRPEMVSILGPTLLRLLSDSAYYGLMAMAIAMALIALGVPGSYILAAITIVLVLLGLALQQSLTNFAATVIFLVFQPFRRGELIETMGKLGTVQEILLFNTTLLMLDQRLVSLPNSKIQESGVVNYSRLGIIRADVRLTVGYEQELGRARAVLADILSHDPRILANPPCQVAVVELGDNGVRLAVYAMVSPDDYWSVLSDLRERIKTRFDAEKIAFALPQRDVRLTATSLTGHDGTSVE
jgi:small conductance mechanosensitive channel